MKRKIRRQSNWDEWKTSRYRHNTEILAAHIAAIMGVFACIAFF
ncbi:hypothetical protein [Elizabethkingia meningoseptica]|nr:hypothetical protein [Elizabethkingia meningoseptica]